MKRFIYLIFLLLAFVSISANANYTVAASYPIWSDSGTSTPCSGAGGTGTGYNEEFSVNGGSAYWYCQSGASDTAKAVCPTGGTLINPSPDLNPNYSSIPAQCSLPGNPPGSCQDNLSNLFEFPAGVPIPAAGVQIVPYSPPQEISAGGCAAIWDGNFAADCYTLVATPTVATCSYNYIENGSPAASTDTAGTLASSTGIAQTLTVSSNSPSSSAAASAADAANQAVAAGAASADVQNLSSNSGSFQSMSLPGLTAAVQQAAADVTNANNANQAAQADAVAAGVDLQAAQSAAASNPSAAATAAVAAAQASQTAAVASATATQSAYSKAVSASQSVISAAQGVPGYVPPTVSASSASSGSSASTTSGSCTGTNCGQAVCGGPGLPDCNSKIDETGTPGVGSASGGLQPAITGVSTASTAIQAGQSAVAANATDTTLDGWLPSFPAGSCTDPVFQLPSGHSGTVSVCQYLPVASTMFDALWAGCLGFAVMGLIAAATQKS